MSSKALNTAMEMIGDLAQTKQGEAAIKALGASGAGIAAVGAGGAASSIGLASAGGFLTSAGLGMANTAVAATEFVAGPAIATSVASGLSTAAGWAFAAGTILGPFAVGVAAGAVAAYIGGKTVKFISGLFK